MKNGLHGSLNQPFAAIVRRPQRHDNTEAVKSTLLGGYQGVILAQSTLVFLLLIGLDAGTWREDQLCTCLKAR